MFYMALTFLRLSHNAVENNDLTGTVSFPCSMPDLNFTYDEDEIVTDCPDSAPSNPNLDPDPDSTNDNDNDNDEDNNEGSGIVTNAVDAVTNVLQPVAEAFFNIIQSILDLFRFND